MVAVTALATDRNQMFKKLSVKLLQRVCRLDQLHSFHLSRDDDGGARQRMGFERQAVKPAEFQHGIGDVDTLLTGFSFEYYFVQLCFLLSCF